MVNKEEVASLIKKCKGGDEKSFDELYEKLWNLFYYLAKQRLINKTDAMDIVQETMMLIYKNIDKLENDDASLAWMTSILYNRCFRENMSYKNFKLVDFDQLGENISDESIEFLPEEVLNNKETWAEISNIVSELPDEQREAILMFYIQMLKTNEIAKIMNISPNAVKLKLSRARVTIKAKVEEMQKKGVVMYSLTTTPILTQILYNDIEKVCTPEIGEQIFAALQTSIAAGGLVTIATAGGAATGATSTGVASATATSGLAVKISATILTVSVVSGGVAFAVYNHNTPPTIPTEPIVISAPQTEPIHTTPSAIIVESTPIPTPTPIPTVAPTPVPVPFVAETLEDMVGYDDAALIKSWVEPSTNNRHDDLVALVQNHGMVVDSIFTKASGSETYIIYQMVSNGKTLLICEFYGVESGLWSVVYSLENPDVPLPQVEEIPAWFLETQNQLL